MVRREPSQSLEHELTDRAARFDKSPRHRLLGRIVGELLETHRVHRCERLVGDTLNANGLLSLKSPPGFEWFGAGEAKIARDQDPLITATLGGRQHGSKCRELAVDVAHAEEAHIGRLAVRVPALIRKVASAVHN